MRAIIMCLFLLVGSVAGASDFPSWHPPTEEEQRLDIAAFESLNKEIREKFGDVQSAVVILQGRKVYEFHRDGQADALHAVHSVAKSALALLVGTALQRGQLTSLDQPVLELMPEWKALNTDPRASSITLGHLLSMTPGFDIDDPSGTAPAQAPATAWSRTIGATPGQRFAYDNSVPSIVSAILERATGQPIEALASEQLFKPLAMREPSLQRGKLRMRTEDMAKLGHLVLSNGSWSGQPLMPDGFAAQIIRARSNGGDPVRLPYGLFWWVPSGSTYFASGYGGQLVWVHAPMNLVVAVTSEVSRESPRRGHALKLTRGPLFRAVRARISGAPRE